MPTYSIETAQAEFEVLVERAEAGEEIDIETASGRLVRIVPLTDEEKARLASDPAG